MGNTDKTFTRKELAKIAKEMLSFLDSNKINSADDLEKITGQEKSIDAKSRISAELRPSNLETKAYVVSYNIDGRGTPLEICLNRELSYSKVIAKGDFVLPGYKNFSIDCFGNTIQDKKISAADFALLKSELQMLASQKN